jgi:NADH:ubiquinone oxidoreductase subunit 5 (subunit L)/multisubunit Na+/H+ antiporter MnhA subunit
MYTLTVGVTMLLTLSLYIVTFYRVFLQGHVAEEKPVEVKEAPFSMMLPLLAYVVALLVLGVGFFLNLITAEQLRLDLLAETIIKVGGGG